MEQEEQGDIRKISPEEQNSSNRRKGKVTYGKAQ